MWQNETPSMNTSPAIYPFHEIDSEINSDENEIHIGSTLSLERQRYLWVKRHLPIIVQPLIDIQNQNALLCCFYEFDETGTICTLSPIYESEGSYNRRNGTQINWFGSILYRSYNLWKYHRTADVNHFSFHGVNLTSETHPYTHLCTHDYSGDQVWNVGAKRPNLLYYYSLVHHYTLHITREEWHEHNSTQLQESPLHHKHESRHLLSPITNQYHVSSSCEQIHVNYVSSLTPRRKSRYIHTHPHEHTSSSITCPITSGSHYPRPIVYVNTSNHTCSPRDNNPDLRKHVYTDYPIFAGNREQAEQYARRVPLKTTLFSVFRCFLCWRSRKYKQELK